jgi:hypothetical protein
VLLKIWAAGWVGLLLLAVFGGFCKSYASTPDFHLTQHYNSSLNPACIFKFSAPLVAFYETF